MALGRFELLVNDHERAAHPAVIAVQFREHVDLKQNTLDTWTVVTRMVRSYVRTKHRLPLDVRSDADGNGPVRCRWVTCKAERKSKAKAQTWTHCSARAREKARTRMERKAKARAKSKYKPKARRNWRAARNDWRTPKNNRLESECSKCGTWELDRLIDGFFGTTSRA